MNKTPLSFSDYIGQDKIKKDLLIQLQAAKFRKEPVAHFLLSGPEQMGKSTLAIVVAREMGVNAKVVNCGAKLRGGDYAAILSGLRAYDFLILERPELLNEDAVEILYPAMKDFALDIVIGKKDAAKNMRLKLPHFTVVGLSAQSRRINSMLRQQFLFHYEFAPYSRAENSRLIDVFVKEHKQSIVPAAANLLASYCGGNLVAARTLAKKAADYCLVKRQSAQIDYMGAIAALANLGYLDKPDSLAQILDSLGAMSGTEFEEFIADFFSRLGYTVELTKASGDHGIDLFLKRGNENIVVQCKRWSKPVGEPTIRDFYGALLNSGATNGMVITTATFTSQALAFVEKKPILLIDLDRLVGLVRRYSEKN